jgi:photosystem II stability/assembly factor-like uncharacterized protein
MKRIFLLLIMMAVSILLAGSGPARAQGPDEGPWPVYAITYGKGIILTSPDSETWTVRHSGTDVRLAALAHGKDTFVAVGGRGTVVTGTRDGSTWATRKSGVTSDLWAVKFARGIFVAVGAAGTVITSPDGYTWTKRANLTPYALRNVSYGKDNFVTIGEMGAIFNSKDGISWARTKAQITDHLFGLCYVPAKGAFVGVGGNGKIMTSLDDGTTWTERYSGTTEYLSAITYGTDRFVAVGAYGTIVTSPDSLNWTTVSSGSQSWLAAVVHARKKFIAVSGDGTTLTSPDGTNWAPQL